MYERLYAKGRMRNLDEGFDFRIKNLIEYVIHTRPDEEYRRKLLR